VAKLKDGLVAMRSKLDDLRNKRDELVARSKSARAQAQVHDAISSINILDPTTEIARWEEQVRREEARVAGQAEAAAATIESQFDELQDYALTTEVEARLAELKGGSKPVELEA